MKISEKAKNKIINLRNQQTMAENALALYVQGIADGMDVDATSFNFETMEFEKKPDNQKSD